MKKLSDICKRIGILSSDVRDDISIEGIAVRVDVVRKGYVFFVTDGNARFIDEAFRRGAVCFVSEKRYDAPCVIVDDVRKSLALASADFYDNPEKDLKIVGVVGTNGKTSITELLYRIFSSRYTVGKIGTLGIQFGEKTIETGMTTPDPPEFFGALREMRDSGVEYVFCEVSAHAIHYKKLFGVRLDACVFTNITQDHLDFFQDMDAYAKTKTDYFTEENMKMGIINVDDAYGKAILQKRTLRCVGYGIKEPCDVLGINIRFDRRMMFEVSAFDEVFSVETGLMGIFNVYNALACIAYARICGLSVKKIQTFFRTVRPIEGRMNVVNSSPCVVIDYAHTPDGLQKVLENVIVLTKGKIIVVFGCGGNRDKTKRPIMGEIASEGADICVLTSDNPRYEEPEAIIREIRAGAKRMNTVSITDREQAIRYALSVADAEDCIVICGKGAEPYMEIKGQKIEYNDEAIVRKYLENQN